MRIICISDTHGQHKKIDIPDGDLLIHAGDFCAQGRIREIAPFNEWLGSLPHRHKVVVAGNHDRPFQSEPDVARSLLTNATYLEDSGTTIDGLRIWGSPWQPYFYNWAFNLRTPEELAAKWALIPADTDILVTHGPPYGTMDRTSGGVHAGCGELRKAVSNLAPRLHVFGHIHEGHGVQDWTVYDRNAGLSVNAAVCDEGYRLVHAPIVVDLETAMAATSK